MQIVQLGDEVHQFPDEVSPEDIQHAVTQYKIDKAGEESHRQLRNASLAGAGENAFRAVDVFGAAGRVLRGAGEYAGRLAEDVLRGDVGAYGQPFIPRFRAAPEEELPGPKLRP